jgi:predicted dehydrogenase
LLLEKPVALNVAEFDQITLACENNGVQFMDNTMWVHNPRTAAMAQVFNDKNRFGQLKSVNFTFILLFYMHCIFVLPYGFGPLGVLTFQRSFAKESHIY